MDRTAQMISLSGAPIFELTLGLRRNEHRLSFFYEIRSTTDTVLKRTGGFASQDAAKIAAREDAKKMKAVPKPPSVGRILVGQNTAPHNRP